MPKVLVLNGPNLNMLGRREPEQYGSATLGDIQQQLDNLAAKLSLSLEFEQSNHEGALIDCVQDAATKGIELTIINPGGFTHTSVALRDAFLSVSMPLIEVHLSNVHAREAFRHHSYFSDIAIGTVVGFGAFGYQLALQAAAEWLDQDKVR